MTRTIRCFKCAPVIYGIFISMTCLFFDGIALSEQEDAMVDDRNSVMQFPEQLQPLKNRVLIAEARYKLDQSEQNKALYRTRLEELVGASCLPYLHTLGAPDELVKSPACRAALDELEMISPRNAILLCAQNGYASSHCIQSYAEQELDLSYVPKIDANLPRISTGFERELSALAQEFQQSRSTDTLKKIYSHVRPLLSEHCSLIQVDEVDETELSTLRERNKQVVVSRTRDPVRREVEAYLQQALPQEDSETSSNSKVESAVTIEDKELQEGLEKPEGLTRATPSPQQFPDLFRVRRIPANCRFLIEKLTEAHPRSSLAWCYKLGWYSPSCVNLMEEERRLYADKSEVTSSQTGKEILEQVEVDRF